jgi:hypothetical protein
LSLSLSLGVKMQIRGKEEETALLNAGLFPLSKKKEWGLAESTTLELSHSLISLVAPPSSLSSGNPVLGHSATPHLAWAGRIRALVPLALKKRLGEGWSERRETKKASHLQFDVVADVSTLVERKRPQTALSLF